MANTKKSRPKAGQPGRRGTTPRQAPKMKVIESGRTEQGEPLGLPGERPAGRGAARKKQREAYRHGGTPIGSDPRE